MRISDSELKKLLAKSIKPADLKAAEEDRAQSKEPLLAAIVKRKLINEKDLVKLYGKSINVPFIELADLKIPRSILTKVPERIARKYQAVLFGSEGKTLQLAMADPEDVQAIDFIEKHIGSDVQIFVTTQGDILAAIDQYKGNLSSEITQAIKDSADEEVETLDVSAKDLAEDAPIAKTVNIILEYAIKSRASDVHIEPREGIVQVRYRIDGILRETMTLPRPILPAVISRIKILANLKIDEHRLPQDGRFKFTVGSKTVALRVSTLPVMDGEKVVMRILDESTRALTLEELGIEGKALADIKLGITKPHGMFLVTGPTGSGKSTTLYSILNLLNTPSVNISTVEDPVEYRVTGVNQTQVNTKTGMTFANGLRALLRQDPNIIMVGEIRDSETADLAVQASLTGHLVLSTLHTNNAATSLPRLLDMKIEPFLIASTVNIVVAQRLVRRVCQVCRIAYVPSSTELGEIAKDFQYEAALKQFRQTKSPTPAPVASNAPATKAPEEDKTPEALKKTRHKVIKPAHDKLEASESILEKIAADPNILNRGASDTKAVLPTALPEAPPPPTPATEPKIDPKDLKEGQFTLYKSSPGCDSCGHLGFQGRMGIYEVILVNEAIGKLITSHATSEAIQQAAIAAGMLTMQQDGFIKALRGLTTLEEILRVTRE